MFFDLNIDETIILEIWSVKNKEDMENINPLVFRNMDFS